MISQKVNNYRSTLSGRSLRKEKTIQAIIQKYTVTDNNGCWNWIRGVCKDGYGRVSFKCKTWRVHRLAYLDFYGELDPSKPIDHLCRNRRCANPVHLEQVTAMENLIRGNGVAVTNSKKTKCKRGHDFTKDNTIIRNNRRICRECRKRRYIPSLHKN